jgi:hypothetical protein
MTFSNKSRREGWDVSNLCLGKQLLESNGVGTLVEDDDMAMVMKEGSGRGEVARLEIRERVIVELVLSRWFSINRGNLENVRDKGWRRRAAVDR